MISFKKPKELLDRIRLEILICEIESKTKQA